MKHTLHYEVYTVQRPGLTRDPNMPVGKDELKWVANSSTLIYGEQDAVLVDGFLTIEQNMELIAFIKKSGKKLKYIYITHPHGDHAFGTQLLLDHFPGAKAISTRIIANECIKAMQPEIVESFWGSRFPGQIPARLTPPQALENDTFELEGNELRAIETGFTDTHVSTSLYVPSIDLIVAGDVAYNGIHCYMAETTTATRKEWVAALDKLGALHAKYVVAGHKKPVLPDNPEIIALTKQYLLDFERLNTETTTAFDLYNKMLALYPDYANPGSLWGASTTAKK